MDIDEHIDALAAQTPEKSVTSERSHISIKNENLRAQKSNSNLNNGYNDNPAFNDGVSPLSYYSDYLNAAASFSPDASVKHIFQMV